MKQGDTWWRFQAVLLCKNDSYIHEFMFHCILRSLLTRASFLTSFWKKSCLLSRMLVSFGAPGPLRMAPPKLFHRLSRRLVGISTAASFIGFEVPVRKASKFPVFGLELPEFPKKWCGCPASLKILARLVGWFLVFFLGAGKYEGVFCIVIVNSAHSLWGNPVSCKSTSGHPTGSDRNDR